MNKTIILVLILLFAGCSAAKVNKVILKDKEIIVQEVKILNPDKAIDDRHPVFSPDGTKIAFESDRAGGVMNIWIMDANGNNPKQLTFNKFGASDPAFSPDGKKIVFVSLSEAEGFSDLWIMNIDGADLRQFTEDEEASNFSPVWSPDGENIAFISERLGLYAVWVMKSSGEKPYQVTTGKSYSVEKAYQLTTGGNGDWGPTWSPDGKVIAYASRRDGVKENILFSDDEQREHGYVNKGDIWLVNIKDNSYQQLTTDINIDVLPAYSPDGSKIVFFSERGGASDIWIMNSDGSNQEQFTKGIWEEWKPRYDVNLDFYQGMAYFHLSWSSDSRNIAFTNVRENGKGDIGIIILDIVQR